MHVPTPFDMLMDIIAMFASIVASLYFIATLQHVTSGDVKRFLVWSMSSVVFVMVYKILEVLGEHVFVAYDGPLSYC